MPAFLSDWTAQDYVGYAIAGMILFLAAGTPAVKAVVSKALRAVKPTSGTSINLDGTTIVKVIEQLESRREALVKIVNEAELELAKIDKMLGVKT